MDGVSGFGEVRGAVSAGVDGVPWQLVERFRPTFEATLSDRFSLVATPELELVEGRWFQDEVERTIEGSDLGPLLDVGGCAWPPDPVNGVLHVDRVEDWLRVDRLYLDAYLPRLDLRVGRQAVQWGSALLVNPTDPFPQVLFVEPWRFRAGVNAVRATVPLGDHQAQAFVGADDAFTAVRLAGRGTVHVLGTEGSLVGAYRGETHEALAGVDLKGTLGVGFWAEAALHVPEDADPYEEIATGIDYSFPVLELLYIAGQYWRNGRPPPPGGTAALLASQVEPPVCTVDLGVDPLVAIGLDPEAPIDPYAPPFSGRDYALLVVRSTVVEELAITVAGLQNLGDGTGIAIPQVTVLPTGWLEVTAVAQLPYRAWGDGGEFRPARRDLRLAIPTLPGAPPVRLELGGLVPEATFSMWTRASF